MEFNKKYSQYWESAVNKSVDGTVIAGEQEVLHFLKKLDLKKNDFILDLGCSTGRMCNVLSQYSDYVYGAEPDKYAVDKALSKHPYKEIRQVTAEATGYPAEFFDLVFCWAVFDVVDHFDGLCEINRILKVGGQIFLTCKADNYDPLDVLAFKAEKNAYIKGFPNKFTNLTNLCSQIDLLGFDLIQLITFSRRGDMGKLDYNLIDIGEIFWLSSLPAIEGYEYLMVARKKGPVKDIRRDDIGPLDSTFSKTAKKIAENSGFASLENFFNSIGID